MEVVDLRSGSGTCTSNPLVRLLNIVNKGLEQEIVVLARKDDIPIGILKLLASKNGYEIVVIEDLGDSYEAKLKKKTSS